MTGTGYTLGDFTADRTEEHVVIHAQVGPQGQITLKDGSPLPLLRAGASVQLRVRASSLTDKEQRNALSTLEVRELLPADTELLAIVDARALDDSASSARLHESGLIGVLDGARKAMWTMKDARNGPRTWGPEDSPQPHEGVIRVRLLEPLVMERKGLKAFRLRLCACRVPELPYPDGEPNHDNSLNHALTRISELLEIHRISHTGNVFTRYLAPAARASGTRMVRLSVLRANA